METAKLSHHNWPTLSESVPIRFVNNCQNLFGLTSMTLLSEKLHQSNCKYQKHTAQQLSNGLETTTTRKINNYKYRMSS